MTLPEHYQQYIQEFFDAIVPVRGAYRDDGFSYFAVRSGGSFVLIQGVIFLNTVTSKVPFTHFRSANIWAGHYRLSELNITARELVEQLLSGKLRLPDGELHFPSDSASSYSSYFTPFHPAGLLNQNRINVLRISGGDGTTLIRQPQLDWELKAARTPYDGINELLIHYLLGELTTDNVRVEAIAYNVAVVDPASTVQGDNAKVIVRAANGLQRDKVGLRYRVLSQGTVVTRSCVDGSEMSWDTAADGSHLGTISIDVPDAAVLNCVVTYDDIAQSHSWLADPARAQNPRRAVYEAFDPQLETLKDIVAKAQGRGAAARQFEVAVAWLLWMLGLSVAHLGGTERTQDAADLIATTPLGNVVVVECTTGLLKAENKLALLHDRAQAVRRALDASSNRHLRVLPMIVTSKTRAEIAVDLEQAERLGIAVGTREDLDQALIRTLIISNADQLYDQFEQNVRLSKAKYEASVLSTSPLTN